MHRAPQKLARAASVISVTYFFVFPVVDSNEMCSINGRHGVSSSLYFALERGEWDT